MIPLLLLTLSTTAGAPAAPVVGPMTAQICYQSSWDFSSRLPAPVFTCEEVDNSCRAFEADNEWVSKWSHWEPLLDRLYGDAKRQLAKVTEQTVWAGLPEAQRRLAERRIIASVYSCVEVYPAELREP